MKSMRRSKETRKEVKLMNYNMTGQFTYKDETYDVKYTDTLTTFEKLQFINNTVSWVVGEDYRPILKRFAYRYNLCLLSDVDFNQFVSADENGSNVAELIEFIDNTDLPDIIEAELDMAVVDELKENIDLDIEYRTGIHRDSISSAISDLINKFSKKMDEVLTPDTLDALTKIASMADPEPKEMVNAFIDNNEHHEQIEALIQKNIKHQAQAKKRKK